MPGNQLDLFLPARRDDPPTSKRSAREVVREGRAKRLGKLVADAVRRFPGRTARELAHASGLYFESCHKRLPECERAGSVRKGEPRRCMVSRRQSTTWWPA